MVVSAAGAAAGAAASGINWGAIASGAGGAIGGIGSLVGGILGSNSAKDAAASSGKWGLISQQMQQAWEEKKLKNAYQWTVQDMHAAGLNPALAYQNGANQAGGISGINYNSTAQATAGQIMAQGISGMGQAAYNYVMDKQKLDNETTMVKANAAKTLSETGIIEKYGDEKARAEIRNLISDVLKNNATTKQTELTNEIMSGGINTAKNVGKVTEQAIEKLTTLQLKSMKQKYQERINKSWQERKKNLGIK